MEVSEELVNRIQDMIESRINEYLGSRAPRQITWAFSDNLKTTAGMAYPSRFHIALNRQLFLANTDSFFANTIPHEIAHLITAVLFPNAKQSHGKEWRQVMVSLGVDPRKTHNYDLSVTTARPRIRYSCACKDQVWQLSKTIHNRISKGQKYFCKTCSEPVFPL